MYSVASLAYRDASRDAVAALRAATLKRTLSTMTPTREDLHATLAAFAANFRALTEVVDEEGLDEFDGGVTETKNFTNGYMVHRNLYRPIL